MEQFSHNPFIQAQKNHRMTQFAPPIPSGLLKSHNMYTEMMGLLVLTDVSHHPKDLTG